MSLNRHAQPLMGVEIIMLCLGLGCFCAGVMYVFVHLVQLVSFDLSLSPSLPSFKGVVDSTNLLFPFHF